MSHIEKFVIPARSVNIGGQMMPSEDIVEYKVTTPSTQFNEDYDLAYRSFKDSSNLYMRVQLDEVFISIQICDTYFTVNTGQKGCFFKVDYKDYDKQVLANVIAHMGDNKYIGDGFTIFYNIDYCNGCFLIEIKDIIDYHLQTHVKGVSNIYKKSTTLLNMDKDIGDMIYKYSLMRRDVRFATVIGNTCYPGLLYSYYSTVYVFIDEVSYNHFIGLTDYRNLKDDYYSLSHLISNRLDSYPTRSGPKNANSAIAPI